MVTDVNLAVGKVEKRYDGAVALGSVISSDPAAGTRLLKGKEVTLFVSKGPKPVKVPTVNGLSVDAATKKLRDAGFSAPITQVKKYSSRLAVGLVVSMTPQSGTKQLQSVSLTLVVSNGPPPVVVPDVIGKSMKDAFSALESKGLKPAKGPSTICKKGFSKSAVEKQSVDAGKSVPRGTTIELRIFFVCKIGRAHV